MNALKKLAGPVYSRLPDPLKRRVKYYSYLRSLKEIEKLKTPTSLVFFVTNRCNARCRHCFFWKELNRCNNELNLEQIRSFVCSLKHPTSISLTGGEPFLRSDLVEICRIFSDINHSPSMQLSTNGFLPDRIFETFKGIVAGCNFNKFSVQISLDGLEETHDKIRGVPGAFNKVCETIEKLSGLARNYPNFEIKIATVIMHDNYHEIEELIKFMQQFNVSHKFSLVRGAYSTFNLSPDISSELDPEEEQDIRVPDEALEQLLQRIHFLNDSSETGFLSKLQQDKLKLSLDTLEAKKRILPCFAGKIDGAVYSNGDVTLCEQVIPIGNLRETAFDFHKLWNSQKANELRRKTKGCACLYGCTLCTSIGVVPEIFRNDHPLKNKTKC